MTPSLDQIIIRTPKISVTSRNYYLSIARNFHDYAAGTSRDYSPETVREWRDDLLRRKLQTDSVVSYLRALRFIAARYPGGDFTAGVENPKHRPNQAVLTVTECQRLLATTRGQGTRERRDRALIALLLGAALRPSEAVSLHVRDLTAPRRRDGLISVLRRRLGPVTTALIRPWALMSPGPMLFPGIRGRGDHTRVTGLTSEGVSRTLRKRAKRARIAHFTPKRLCFTFAALADKRGWSRAEIDALGRRERRESIDVIASVIELADAGELDRK